jgi:hypothetical protein
VKELPEDLTALEPEELTREGRLRDEVLVPLFRRWPALDRMEMGQLRDLYADRVRIAQHLGRLRPRKRG